LSSFSRWRNSDKISRFGHVENLLEKKGNEKVLDLQISEQPKAPLPQNEGQKNPILRRKRVVNL